MTSTTAGGYCEATADLPSALRTRLLQTYPTVDRELIAEELVCALEAHSGAEHHAVVYDHFREPVAGALWTCWEGDEPPRALWLRPDCPGASPGGAACGHFAGHPGPHSWETDEKSCQPG